MENNMEQNLETNNIEVNNEGQQPNQPVDNANNSNQDGNGTDTTVNQPANLEEWQKDGRYGKMWKKPDDVYSSYTSLEKSFNDVNPKYKALVKLLKDNGFQENTLADELKKFEEYRNPESRRNKVYDYVNSFLENEIYLPRVQQFFEQLEQEELQRLYPNMNAEQIAKQQAMDKEIKELKAREAQRQADLALQQDTNLIIKGLKDCEELAKQYGFKLNDEVKDYLLSYCNQNNIDPKYIKNEFISLYGQKLLEARDKKVIENQEKNKKKLEQAQILGGGNNEQPMPSSNVVTKDNFTKRLFKIIGK